MRVSGSGVAALLLIAGGSWGCGSSTPGAGPASLPKGGQSSTVKVPDAGGSPYLCSDLFDQSVLQTYAIDITPDNWAKLDADFHDLKDVLAGTPPQTYYPVTFHFGSETVTNAAVRLLKAWITWRNSACSCWAGWMAWSRCWSRQAGAADRSDLLGSHGSRGPGRRDGRQQRPRPHPPALKCALIWPNSGYR